MVASGRTCEASETGQYRWGESESMDELGRGRRRGRTEVVRAGLHVVGRVEALGEVLYRRERGRRGWSVGGKRGTAETGRQERDRRELSLHAYERPFGSPLLHRGSKSILRFSREGEARLIPRPSGQVKATPSIRVEVDGNRETNLGLDRARSTLVLDLVSSGVGLLRRELRDRGSGGGGSTEEPEVVASQRGKKR